jgi:hypothetical protein
MSIRIAYALSGRSHYLKAKKGPFQIMVILLKIPDFYYNN